MLKCVIGVCICLHASAHSIDGAGHSMFLGCLWLCVSTYVHPCLRRGIPWSCHWLLLLKISFCKATVANCHCVCCLQRIYVHKVLQCVDVCTDGWLHPRLPFWVSLATVAACSKRLRLDEVSGTRKSKQLATSTLHNIWIQFFVLFLCIT